MGSRADGDQKRGKEHDVMMYIVGTSRVEKEVDDCGAL